MAACGNAVFHNFSDINLTSVAKFEGDGPDFLNFIDFSDASASLFSLKSA